MTTDTTAPSGLKYDAGKPPMMLLDKYALEQIALVLAYGAQKYSKNNWRNGIEVTRLLDAAIRHIYASDYEDIDAESGLPHLAHAGCCIMFALWMRTYKPHLDDRWLGGEPPPEPTPPPDPGATTALNELLREQFADPLAALAAVARANSTTNT